ncbi:T2SSF domain-containing protein [Caenorhabditis elegans]|uniref:T2SSF domain-containing protein n=1 Tax=Caenorhabditis elegans TaxID=6239 RepID=Q19154_CAEEL|nr:T2SSF domain-containing protein [Caenorhabditis elegans]CCD68936.1 T2SSF domain-containing protein [Caenorhabditis elegans]|eukprot:NP_505397.1 Uncharacterized protein CELE_F07C3.9 [Caenorhabditis elegans]
MPRNYADIIGRNADRLIKKYEHIPTIISAVTLVIGIFVCAIPVIVDHMKRANV